MGVDRKFKRRILNETRKKTHKNRVKPITGITIFEDEDDNDNLPMMTCKYAEDVIKDRWPEAEPIQTQEIDHDY